MSAEVLRRAATLMRERAEAAAPSPWTAYDPDAGTELAGRFTCIAMDAMHPTAWAGTGEHIASWHPAVALAVADWLDSVASNEHEVGPEGCADCDPALAAARAYLGGAA